MIQSVLSLLVLGMAGCVSIAAIRLASGAAGAQAGSLDWRSIYMMAWPIATLAAIGVVMAQGRQAELTAGEFAGVVGNTRVAVLEAGVALDSEFARIGVGGDPVRDDIVIEGLPAGAFEAVRGRDGAYFTLRRVPNDDESRFALFVGETRARPGVRVPLPDTPVQIAYLANKRDVIPADLTIGQLDDFGEPRLLDLIKPPGGWIVRFDKPEFFNVARGNIRLASADTRNQRNQSDDVKAFTTLGARFAPSFDNTELVLPAAEGAFTLVRGGGQESPFPNNAVEIEHRGFKTVLRIDPLTIDSGLKGRAWSIMVIIVLLSLALSVRVRRMDPLTAGLLGVAEMLLVLRVVLAIEGTMLDEGTRVRQALPDALMALPMGLAVMHAALQPMGSQHGGAQARGLGGLLRGTVRLALAPAVLLGAAALVGRAIAHEMPDAIASSKVVVICVGLMGGVFGARLLLPLVQSAPVATPPVADEPRSLSWFKRLRALLLAWCSPLRALVGTLGLAIVLKGVSILGFGTAERTELFAWSSVYIPLALIGFVPLLLAVFRGGERLALIGLLLIGGIAVVMATHTVAGMLFAKLAGWRELESAVDVGLALMLALSLSFTAAVVWSADRRRAGWRAWLAAFAIACLVVRGVAEFVAGNTLIAVVLIGVGAVSALAVAVSAVRAQPEPDHTPALWRAGTLWTLGLSGFAALALFTSVGILHASPSSAPASVADLPEKSRAILRLVAALAPERLGFFVSDGANGERESLAAVALYGGEGAGAGYLNVPVARGVRGQQFSDFAIAVHFVYPFGRMALAGLLLFLSTLVLLANVRVQQRDWAGLLGTMMVTTFVTTSFYIALSNLHLVPVTGRNFYLLAPQSNSDLLEGLMLLAGAAALLRASPSQRKELQP